MRVVFLLFVLFFFSFCNKKEVEPTKRTIKELRFSGLQTNDTVFVTVNSRKGFYSHHNGTVWYLKAGDEVRVNYSPQSKSSQNEYNFLQILLAGQVIKSYNCSCQTDHFFIVD